MTGTARVVATLAIFAAMVALVDTRPRRSNDAWWTTLAAATMLALGLVTPHECLQAHRHARVKFHRRCDGVGRESFAE